MYKVLLVDDNEAMRMLIRRLNIWNEKTGFLLADEARNGKEALEKLEAQPMELVITDIRMPVIDGMELLQKIVEKNLNSCVVFISDYSEFEYARKGLVLGAFDYLVKPVKEAELLAMLARVKEHLDSRTKEGLLYPEIEAKRVTDKLLIGDYSYQHEIHALAGTISDAARGNIQKQALIIKSVYKNVQAELRDKYPWVDQFIYMNMFEKEFESRLLKEEAYLILKKSLDDIIDFIDSFLLKNRDDNMIYKICEYVLSSKEEPSLQSISQRLFMNSSYISSTFKEKTGITISDYILKVKMERAKKILSDKNIKAFEAANALGYKDVEYFSRQFKKYTGVTPTQYKTEFKL